MGGVGADWAGTGGLYLAGAGGKDAFVSAGALCFFTHQYRRSGIPDEKEHLEAMLNSVSKQSYPHWELIVADAGGTAESVQTWAKKNGICLREAADASNLAEWKDQSIVLCTLSENKGISANTNAGIELAAGDAVGLLDHDDLLTANALWEMADCLEKEKKRGKQKLVLFSDEDKCDGAASRFYERISSRILTGNCF